MRINRLIAAGAIVGLVVLASNVMALEADQPATRGIIHRTVDPVPPGDHSGVPTISDACPAENVGVLADGDTIVGSTIGSAHDFGGDPFDNFGGECLDEIFEFSVSLQGEWSFDTCTVPACFDTTAAPVISSTATVFCLQGGHYLCAVIAGHRTNYRAYEIDRLVKRAHIYGKPVGS